jgi:hypothetical protein
MVLGIAAGAQAGTGLPLCDNPATNNALLMVSSVTVVGTQSDDDLVCVVYLEPTDVGQARPVGTLAKGDTIRLLPDAMTLVSLGLVGLFYRRRSAPGFRPCRNA